MTTCETGIIRIATRTSELALWQAGQVRRLLLESDPNLSPDQLVLVPIDSAGDLNQQDGFERFGYKGIFTKAIEAALLDGRADLAVHSMKDVHSELPDSLCIAGMLTRENPADAFISTRYDSIESLPQNAVVGTASIRRKAGLLHWRPDLTIKPLRGNVPTRLAKLESEGFDAIILAVAGLTRLGAESRITAAVSLPDWLPAVAQGAIGIECRANNGALRARIEAISDSATMQSVTAERHMLARLDGDCHSPIGGLAMISGDELSLRGCWIESDGSACYHAQATGQVSHANIIAEKLADDILKQKRPSVENGI